MEKEDRIMLNLGIVTILLGLFGYYLMLEQNVYPLLVALTKLYGLLIVLGIFQMCAVVYFTTKKRYGRD